MITAADMRKHHLQRPFQPFRIYLTDGRFFDIHDPTWNLPADAIFLLGLAPDNDPRSRLP